MNWYTCRVCICVCMLRWGGGVESNFAIFVRIFSIGVCYLSKEFAPLGANSFL